MTTYTYEQIADNFRLWKEYADPDATMTEAEFDEMSTEQKVRLQVEAFGPERGWKTTQIDITALDQALVADIAGEEGFQCFQAEYEGATVANQCYHIAFNADSGRGGIVFVGSGSSGVTHWTDAESPADVLSRFLSDDMRP